MKQLLASLLLLLGCLDVMAAPAVTPGLPIARYQNRGTLHGSDLFILAVTNTVPPTNMNATFAQVSNDIASAISSGLINYETLTNGIRVALSTNVNWTFGVTGYLSGTSLNLGVDPNLFTYGVDLAPGTTVILVDGATNSIVNRTSVLTSATSLVFTNLQIGLPIRWWGFSSNGAWDVTVPQSHDSNTVSRGIEQPFSNTWVMVEAIRFSSGWTNFDSESQAYTIGPGTNVVFDTNLITRHISVSAAGTSITNTLYQTNGVDLGSAGTINFNSGLTGYVASGVIHLGTIPLGAVFETNQFTTNVAGTPVIGGIWWNGTNSIAPPFTNGARVGVEWTPVQRSLRVGELGNTGAGPDIFDSTTLSSNYWHATNIGFGSIAFGSNVMAKAPYSFIGNGIFNIVGTNAVASSITGGSNNIIYTNAVFSHIGGGANNTIRQNTIYGTIGGGDANDVIGAQWGTIGGGDRNDIQRGSTSATIGGGSVNTIGTGSASAEYSTIAGGRNNQADSPDSFIGGGQQNIINSAANTGSVIGGGTANNINQDSIYAVVAGGNNNDLGVTASGDSDYSSIGGGQNHLMQGDTDYGHIGGGLSHIIGTSSRFGQILGGASNNISTSVTMAAIVGNFITNTTSKSVEIGITNTSKMRIEAFNARMIGMGTLYASNTFAMPTAATLGVGGYWVGNSNGVLVTVYTLDGTTTIMKTLAP